MSKFSNSKQKFEYLERNLTIFNSNKMQLLLNASKTWQSIPAGSSKKLQPSKKNKKTNKVW